ncbi:transporter substrate-binding domain-containing protein [Pseudoroseicyclus tamaricis]|uniref:ABC transporter substrate-binding protein n=1 Tax=Pseudoroseicyclus tamaricis TaxID=2705421 RepID=A0A6B2K0I7_9RHOB|nr:transporter substrate-binding domain-containing protein [Pseudoroseicyclus tamaricis]NDV01192.1 ABC transporter substrate-binding protein [Pseudoroseicyclus tamaricis]
MRPIQRALAAASVAGMALSTAAAAQEGIISRDIYQDRLRNDGNKITFCYNPFGMMAGFERELAETLGMALLAEVDFFEISRGDLQTIQSEYDYRIPLTVDQIFYMFVQYCDAFMGFLVNDRNPEWVTVSRPYLSAETVIFSRDEDADEIGDLPGDTRIGTRMMAPGDAQLINFLSAQRADWTRVPYYDNALVLERIEDGSNTAGMMWLPGLLNATGGDPEAAGYHILPQMPFQVRSVDVGIATRAQDSFLNTTLSDAIAALQADGTIEAMLVAHDLARPDGG